jgi:PilZ domain
MHSLKPEERREKPRYPLERLAKIQLGFDSPPSYCLITDISDGGVRIHLNGLEVPDEFVLLLSGDGPAKDGRYRVVWRHGNEVGAKLVS